MSNKNSEKTENFDSLLNLNNDYDKIIGEDLNYEFDENDLKEAEKKLNMFENLDNYENMSSRELKDILNEPLNNSLEYKDLLDTGEKRKNDVIPSGDHTESLLNSVNLKELRETNEIDEDLLNYNFEEKRDFLNVAIDGTNKKKSVASRLSKISFLNDDFDAKQELLNLNNYNDNKKRSVTSRLSKMSFLNDDFDGNKDFLNLNIGNDGKKNSVVPRFSKMSLLNDDYLLKDNIDVDEVENQLKNKRASISSAYNLKNSSVFNLSATDENVKDSSSMNLNYYDVDKSNASLTKGGNLDDSDLISVSPLSMKRNTALNTNTNTNTTYEIKVNRLEVSVGEADMERFLDGGERKQKNRRKGSVDILNDELDELKKQYLGEENEKKSNNEKNDIDMEDENDDLLMSEYVSDSEFLKRSSPSRRKSIEQHSIQDEVLTNDIHSSRNSVTRWEDKINCTRKVKIMEDASKRGILKQSNSLSPVKETFSVNENLRARKKSVQFSHRSVAVFDEAEKISPLHLTQFTRISSDSNKSDIKKKRASEMSEQRDRDAGVVSNMDFIKDVDKSPIDKLLYRSHSVGSVNNSVNGDVGIVRRASSVDSITFKTKRSIDNIESARLSPLKDGAVDEPFSDIVGGETHAKDTSRRSVVSDGDRYLLEEEDGERGMGIGGRRHSRRSLHAVDTEEYYGKKEVKETNKSREEQMRENMEELQGKRLPEEKRKDMKFRSSIHRDSRNERLLKEDQLNDENKNQGILEKDGKEKIVSNERKSMRFIINTGSTNNSTTYKRGSLLGADARGSVMDRARFTRKTINDANTNNVRKNVEVTQKNEKNRLTNRRASYNESTAGNAPKTNFRRTSVILGDVKNREIFYNKKRDQMSEHKMEQMRRNDNIAANNRSSVTMTMKPTTGNRTSVRNMALVEKLEKAEHEEMKAQDDVQEEREEVEEMGEADKKEEEMFHSTLEMEEYVNEKMIGEMNEGRKDIEENANDYEYNNRRDLMESEEPYRNEDQMIEQEIKKRQESFGFNENINNRDEGFFHGEDGAGVYYDAQNYQMNENNEENREMFVNNYEQNNYEQNNYEQNNYEQNNYEQNNYEHNNYEPNKYEPNNYEPNNYEPNNYEQNNYEQNNYEPNNYEQNNYEQNNYEPNNYEPNIYEDQRLDENNKQAYVEGDYHNREDYENFQEGKENEESTYMDEKNNDMYWDGHEGEAERGEGEGEEGEGEDVYHQHYEMNERTEFGGEVLHDQRKDEYYPLEESNINDISNSKAFGDNYYDNNNTRQDEYRYFQNDIYNGRIALKERMQQRDNYNNHTFVEDELPYEDKKDDMLQEKRRNEYYEQGEMEREIARGLIEHGESPFLGGREDKEIKGAVEASVEVKREEEHDNADILRHSNTCVAFTQKEAAKDLSSKELLSEKGNRITKGEIKEDEGEKRENVIAPVITPVIVPVRKYVRPVKYDQFGNVINEKEEIFKHFAWLSVERCRFQSQIIIYEEGINEQTVIKFYENIRNMMFKFVNKVDLLNKISEHLEEAKLKYELPKITSSKTGRAIEALKSYNSKVQSKVEKKKILLEKQKNALDKKRKKLEFLTEELNKRKIRLGDGESREEELNLIKKYNERMMELRLVETVKGIVVKNINKYGIHFELLNNNYYNFETLYDYKGKNGEILCGGMSKQKNQNDYNRKDTSESNGCQLRMLNGTEQNHPMNSDMNNHPMNNHPMNNHPMNNHPMNNHPMNNHPMNNYMNNNMNSHMTSNMNSHLNHMNKGNNDNGYVLGDMMLPVGWNPNGIINNTMRDSTGYLPDGSNANGISNENTDMDNINGNSELVDTNAFVKSNMLKCVDEEHTSLIDINDLYKKTYKIKNFHLNKKKRHLFLPDITEEDLNNEWPYNITIEIIFSNLGKLVQEMESFNMNMNGSPLKMKNVKHVVANKMHLMNGGNKGTNIHNEKEEKKKYHNLFRPYKLALGTFMHFKEIQITTYYKYINDENMYYHIWNKNYDRDNYAMHIKNVDISYEVKKIKVCNFKIKNIEKYSYYCHNLFLGVEWKMQLEIIKYKLLEVIHKRLNEFTCNNVANNGMNPGSGNVSDTNATAKPSKEALKYLVEESEYCFYILNNIMFQYKQLLKCFLNLSNTYFDYHQHMVIFKCIVTGRDPSRHSVWLFLFIDLEECFNYASLIHGVVDVKIESVDEEDKYSEECKAINENLTKKLQQYLSSVKSKPLEISQRVNSFNIADLIYAVLVSENYHVNSCRNKFGENLKNLQACEKFISELLNENIVVPVEIKNAFDNTDKEKNIRSF